MQVRIDYTRPPDRVQVFEQQLVYATDACIVTLLEHTPLGRTMLVDGEVALEDGAPVVWFTFPGVWHDIGRFHTADGRFTGCYANVLTPVEQLSPLHWRTTDLYLDVWLPQNGEARLLDEDELADAEHRQVVSSDLADTARAHAAQLLQGAHSGVWPPSIVHAWTLERARQEVHRAGQAGP